MGWKMRMVGTWARLSKWMESLVAHQFLRFTYTPVCSFHTSPSLNKTKEKERTVFQTSDFIPPRTALFVSGSTSQFTTFVVDPHFDFDERFADLENYQKEIHLRLLPFNLQKISKDWSELQILWKRRAELEAARKESAASFSKPSDVSEESKLKGRLLRDEIKQLNKNIADVEIETITTLLKLPVRLHKDVPAGNEPFVAFTMIENQESNSFENTKSKSHFKNGRNMCGTDDVMHFFQRSKLVEFSDEAPRGYFLRGEAAELELRLISCAKNFLERKGYSGISGPHLYKSIVLEGAGFINDEHDDVSRATEKLSKPNSNQPILIDTVDSRSSIFRSQFLTNSPVNLYAAYLTNCEAAESNLPLRFHSSSRVYRAASIEQESDYQNHLRLISPSQTHTVSLCTVFSDAEKTEEYLNEILESFRIFYLTLGVHFRLVSIPASELGTSEALRYDLEAWSPVLSKFVPSGHVAFHDDFISKRLRCHVDKPEQNKFLRFITGSLIDLTPFISCCIDDTGDQLLETIRTKSAFML